MTHLYLEDSDAVCPVKKRHDLRMTVSNDSMACRWCHRTFWITDIGAHDYLERIMKDDGS